MARDQKIYETNNYGGGVLVDRTTELPVGFTAQGVDQYMVIPVADPLTGGITSLMASGRDVVADLGLGGSPVAPVLLGLTGVPSGTAQRLIQSPILDGALSPYAWDTTTNLWTDGGGSYIDYTTQFGYNANRVVTNDVSAIMQIESKFRQGPTDPFGVEFMWQFTSADGAIFTRPLSAWVSHVDGTSSVSSCGAWTWYNSAMTPLMQLGETGILDLAQATSLIRSGTNNVAILQQLNAENSAYLPLPFINSSNQTQFGNAFFSGTVQFNGALSNASFSGDVNFNAGTAIFGSGQGTRISDGLCALNAAGLLSWSATTHAYDTRDTSISRVSAGVVGIGTGAAGSVNAALQALSYKSAAPSGGTAAVWKLGVAATVSPTAPNRTLEVEIGGTTYYVHAKTTNN